MEFRFKALRHAHDPDDLDVPVNLASPKSWITVFVILVTIVAAGGWAFLDRLPQTETGSGVLSRTDGVVRVEIGYQAVVQRTLVVAGGHVVAGQQLITVRDGADTARTVVAPVAGTVMVADYPAGVVVQPGVAVVVLERDPSSGPQLAAIVVVPLATASAIRPGMSVDLTVASVPARVYGLLQGTVSAVSGYPVTAAGLQSVIYDPALVQSLLAPGAATLVTVQLVNQPSSASGYRWTSPAGPPFPLAFQSAVTASFHLGDRRPIDYVFGDST